MVKSVPNNGGVGGFWSNTRPMELFLGLLLGLSVFFIFSTVQDSAPDLNQTLLAPESASATAAITETTGTKSFLKHKRQYPNKKRLYDPSWDVYQVIEAEQTGRIVGPRTEAPIPRRDIFFLDDKQLSHGDGYSGSWLVRTEHFRNNMKLDAIQTWEDAAQLAYQDEDTTGSGAKKFSKLRMSLDWLDFR